MILIFIGCTEHCTILKSSKQLIWFTTNQPTRHHGQHIVFIQLKLFLKRLFYLYWLLLFPCTYRHLVSFSYFRLSITYTGIPVLNCIPKDFTNIGWVDGSTPLFTTISIINILKTPMACILRFGTESWGPCIQNMKLLSMRFWTESPGILINLKMR